MPDAPDAARGAWTTPSTKLWLSSRPRSAHAVIGRLRAPSTPVPVRSAELHESPRPARRTRAGGAAEGCFEGADRLRSRDQFAVARLNEGRASVPESNLTLALAGTVTGLGHRLAGCRPRRAPADATAPRLRHGHPAEPVEPDRGRAVLSYSSSLSMGCQLPSSLLALVRYCRAHRSQRPPRHSMSGNGSPGKRAPKPQATPVPSMAPPHCNGHRSP